MAKGAVPGIDMELVGIDECAVDIEDESARFGAHDYRRREASRYLLSFISYPEALDFKRPRVSAFNRFSLHSPGSVLPCSVLPQSVVSGQKSGYSCSSAEIILP